MRHEAAADATMSVEEAGRLLGIGRGTAYRAARDGQIPTLRLGRRLVVPRARLLALLGISADVQPSTTEGAAGPLEERPDAMQSERYPQA